MDLAPNNGRSSAWLSRTNFMFRLHHGSMKKEPQVEFRQALRVHLKQPLLIIRDALKAHRSKQVRESLDCADGEIRRAFLPPYSPDLNPVQYLWVWLERHALANFCPSKLNELNATARGKRKSDQQRPSIIAACWVQAEEAPAHLVDARSAGSHLAAVDADVFHLLQPQQPDHSPNPKRNHSCG